MSNPSTTNRGLDGGTASAAISSPSLETPQQPAAEVNPVEVVNCCVQLARVFQMGALDRD
jgi:hypothetical protein